MSRIGWRTTTTSVSPLGVAIAPSLRLRANPNASSRAVCLVYRSSVFKRVNVTVIEAFLYERVPGNVQQFLYNKTL